MLGERCSSWQSPQQDYGSCMLARPAQPELQSLQVWMKSDHREGANLAYAAPMQWPTVLGNNSQPQRLM